GGVDLHRQALQAGVAELAVGDDQTQRGVAERARRGGGELRQAPARVPRKPLQKIRGLAGLAPPLLLAANQPPVAIGHRAACIDDHEGRDLCLADLAERTALSGVGVAAEELALHAHAAGALRSERKYAGTQRVERRARQALVGIDLVEAVALEIIDL